MECIGCKLANKMEPVHVVFEDEYICCFLDHEPFNEGHVLILPKQHIHDADELDEEAATSIMNASILISKAIKSLFKPDGSPFAKTEEFSTRSHIIICMLCLDTNINHSPLSI